MKAEKREFLGKLVRHVWVEWAKEQPAPKPSWLLPWAELDDGQREVDMRIGEKVKEVCYPRWVDAIEDARREALEKAAQIADKHKGSAANRRRAKGQQFKYLPDDAVAEIQAEERGEDIASEIIARDIRDLMGKQE